MVQVTIRAIVGENRQLHIALPDDFPLGPVLVTISLVSEEMEVSSGTEVLLIDDHGNEKAQLPPGDPIHHSLSKKDGGSGNMEAIMTLVKLKAVLHEDRQLHITLPDEMPVGPVEVTVRSVASAPEIAPGAELTRDQARAILAAAGLLSTGRYAPLGAKRLSDEEREELGHLFGGEPDIATLISEDRDEQWD